MPIFNSYMQYVTTALKTTIYKQNNNEKNMITHIDP